MHTKYHCESVAMKQLLFVHPLGQFSALVLGVFNLVTGISRKCFNTAIHMNCGFMYYFVAMIGAGIGVFATHWAEKNAIVLSMGIHKWNAVLLICLATTGMTTGCMLLRNSEKNVLMLAYHRWLNTAGLILFVGQAAHGIIKIIKLL